MAILRGRRPQRRGSILLGTRRSIATGTWKINNKGQAVGNSSLREWDPGDLTSLIGKPFFYDGQNMLPIDVPGALWGASVWALNDAGEAGGTFYVDNNTYCSLNNCHYTERAFYYANGTAVDLNNLLVNPPGWARIEIGLLHQQQRADPGRDAG